MNIDAETIEELRGLLAKATPGPWHHCQPYMTVPTQRTVHGPIPAERVDYVSTWPDKGTPSGHRVVIDMPGREARVRSEDMALIVAMRNALPALLDLAADSLAREGEDASQSEPALHATSPAVTGGASDEILRLCAVELIREGAFHRWFDNTQLENMDEIGREEFLDLTARVIKPAADRIRALSAEIEAMRGELMTDRKFVHDHAYGDARTRDEIGDRFCLVPPDGGDVKTWEAAKAMRDALESSEALVAELRAENERLCAENADLARREKVRSEAVNKSLTDAQETAQREKDRADFAHRLFDQREDYLAGLNQLISEYRDAVRIDVLMEGPRFGGCNLSQLKRAWEADRARSELEGRNDG